MNGSLLFFTLAVNSSYMKSILEVVDHYQRFASIRSTDVGAQDEANYVIREISRQKLILSVVIEGNFSVDLRTKLVVPFPLLVFLGENMTETLDSAENVVERFHDVKMIFLFTKQPANKTLAATELFSWCLKFAALDAVAIFKVSSDDSEVYSFEPFPKLKLKQIAHDEIIAELNFNKARDAKRIPLRLTLRDDYPHSFTYVNRKGENVTAGYAPKLLKNFIRSVNAEEVLIDKSHVNRNLYGKTHVQKDIMDGKTDFGTAFFGPQEAEKEHIMRTMLFMFTTNSMLLPHSDPVALSSYIILPFQTDMWIFLIEMVCALGIAEYLHNLLILNSNDIGRSLCNAVLGITMQSIPEVKSNNWRLRGIRIQLLFIGFILTSFYLSFLSSFMTTSVYNPQLTTYEKIRNKGVKIFMEESSMHYFLITKKLPEPVDEIFIPVDNVKYFEHIFALNKTYGYAVTDDVKNVILLYQSLLKPPIFFKSDLFLTYPFIGMVIRKDSPFVDIFDEYILNVLSSGILQKWRAQSHLESLEKGFGRSAKFPEDPFSDLTLQHIEFSIMFWCFGLTAASICFIAELVMPKGLQFIRQVRIQNQHSLFRSSA